MGGALSLHTAYRWDKNVAGVFVLSSFLYCKSVVYEELKKSNGIKRKLTTYLLGWCYNLHRVV